MKSHYRVVIIGGGIVGVSVLYHLARAGWTDIALIERSELTAGSTWHAAAGFHAVNSNPNISALQKYTMRLYQQVEAESGQSVGMHMTGGVNVVGSPARLEWLRREWAFFRSMDIDARMMSRDEIAAMCPIIDVSKVAGGMYDPNEGHVDPHGATHAFAIAARQRGAKIVLHNRVLSMQPSAEGWSLQTEKGPVIAEHVVNAGGLWARKVGRMAGVDLPVVPMQHHYLVTDDIEAIASFKGEMPAVTDLDGYTYLRQEGKGVLLGVYEENPVHWMTDGADWNFGMELLPEDLDRIATELGVGFSRFPVLENTGIKRWINGALTFTPDGNPIIGPVPGLRNYWVACGSMAGFSQGGAMGLTLSNWMTEGDPGHDVFGIDVARYGAFGCNDRYLRETTAQFYARRFVPPFPNEELPAGRPLRASPTYEMMKTEHARFGCLWGMENPQYFAPSADFAENLTFKRSNAHDIVGAEVAAVRHAAGLFETSVYARYEVRGPGAQAWLDRLFASRIPTPGRSRLAPMLNDRGKLMGDLTITCYGAQRFWIVGSYYLQEWHMRWFRQHLPERGVEIENLSDSWVGYALSGPKARLVLQSLTSEDMSHAAFPFLSCRVMDVGPCRAHVLRVSLTGELGWEITVPSTQLRALRGAFLEAGRPLGMKPYGLRALDSLRMEKAYGVWNAEFAQCYTPGMNELAHFVAYDKPDFIGRDAALREREASPSQKLVLLQVDTVDADATGFEPVWCGGRRVGFVTSGAYGHHTAMSLAMAYVDRDIAAQGAAASGLTVHVVGVECGARILAEPPYDPRGARMRA